MLIALTPIRPVRLAGCVHFRTTGHLRHPTLPLLSHFDQVMMWIVNFMDKRVAISVTLSSGVFIFGIVGEKFSILWKLDGQPMLHLAAFGLRRFAIPS